MQVRCVDDEAKFCASGGKRPQQRDRVCATRKAHGNAHAWFKQTGVQRQSSTGESISCRSSGRTFLCFVAQHRQSESYGGGAAVARKGR
jgi:hypothetical protein